MKSRDYWQGWADAIGAVNEQAMPGMAETVRDAREKAWVLGFNSACYAYEVYGDLNYEPVNPYRPTGEVA